MPFAINQDGTAWRSIDTANDLFNGETYSEVQPELSVIPPIPTSVTMWQARHALLNAGLYAQVEAALQAMPGDNGQRARIDWDYAANVKRDFPLIIGMQQMFGWTDEQVDALFISASQITA
jgi:hypothetical protein